MTINPYQRPVPRAQQPRHESLAPLYTVRSVIAPGHRFDSKPMPLPKAQEVLEFAAEMYHFNGGDWHMVLYYTVDADGQPTGFEVRHVAGLLASIRIVELI